MCFPPFFPHFGKKRCIEIIYAKVLGTTKLISIFGGDLLLSRVSRKDSFFCITREMDVYVRSPPFATPKFSCFLVLGKRRRILFLHEKRSLCKYGLKRCREKGNKDSFSLSFLLSLSRTHTRQGISACASYTFFGHRGSKLLGWICRRRQLIFLPRKMNTARVVYSLFLLLNACKSSPILYSLILVGNILSFFWRKCERSEIGFASYTFAKLLARLQMVIFWA